MDLESKTVVITANQLNPGAISQVMLCKNGVIDESDAGVFTPNFVQIETHEFHLLAVPDRLQFSPRGENRPLLEVVTGKLGNIVKLLPYTPYAAIGMNFAWRSGDAADIGELSRRLFDSRENPLHSEFTSSDCRFGSYLSKNVFDDTVRMKLTIAPMKSGGTGGYIQASFNFHRDLDTTDPVPQITATLGRWSEANDYAEKLATILGKSI